jgi:hypothetical protein
MISIDWNPDRRTLRTFALGLLVLAVVSTAWLLWQHRFAATAQWVCLIAGGTGLVGACVPTRVRWIYVAWMLAVFPIGWCVFQCLLAILFFGVITPLGFLMKRLGRDPLQLRTQPGATTYWTVRAPSDDPRGHFRQY